MIRLTILGEPASKANSREMATIGRGDTRRTILRKSDKALGYETDALRQIPPAARQRLEGPLRVTLRIWYASERPDLDESLILDILQDRYKTIKHPERHASHSDGTQTMQSGRSERVLVQNGVYRNDRQVREKHVFWSLDRANPRTEIEIEPLATGAAGAQLDLLGEAA